MRTLILPVPTAGKAIDSKLLLSACFRQALITFFHASCELQPEELIWNTCLIADISPAPVTATPSEPVPPVADNNEKCNLRCLY